jgi:hypothetical protein
VVSQISSIPHFGCTENYTTVKFFFFFFLLCPSSGILIIGRSIKSKSPVIMSVIYHRQNPLQSNYTTDLTISVTLQGRMIYGEICQHKKTKLLLGLQSQKELMT